MFDKSTRSKQVCQLLLSLIVAKKWIFTFACVPTVRHDSRTDQIPTIIILCKDVHSKLMYV